MTRERLPNRRQHELISFQHAGINYVAGIGRFADGRLAEVFLNGAKCGTDADTSAKDAAIVASLALQAGVSAAVIRHALTSNRDGSVSCPLGRIFDIVGEVTAVMDIPGSK